MKTNKLFQALVITGALMGATASANETVEGNAVNAILEDAEKQLAFCSPDDKATCEMVACGVWKPKQGIECCWGTSCDAGE